MEPAGGAEDPVVEESSSVLEHEWSMFVCFDLNLLVRLQTRADEGSGGVFGLERQAHIGWAETLVRAECGGIQDKVWVSVLDSHQVQLSDGDTTGQWAFPCSSVKVVLTTHPASISSVSRPSTVSWLGFCRCVPVLDGVDQCLYQ